MSKPIKYLNALQPNSPLKEYEILGVLGSGGFGVTYRGFDRLLSKTVAIKEFLPNDLAVRSGSRQVLPKSSADREDFAWGLERFLDEARVLASFDHSNIIRVYRFFRANGTGYIVMDYAEGETLRDLLERERVLTPSRLKALLFPLLDGLQDIHGKGVLHRDIKPGNIMILKKDGSPVLIDFGAARQAINAKSRSITAIVTPGYAPIEQYSTTGDQGPGTDIYALAAVAYRAIVGERPDDATNRLSDDKLEGWTRKARGWDRNFLDAVDKGLSFSKDNRPRSVTEWRTALSVRDAPSGVFAKRFGVGESHGVRSIAERVVRRVNVRWAASAVGLVGLLLFAAYLYVPERIWIADEFQAEADIAQPLPVTEVEQSEEARPIADSTPVDPDPPRSGEEGTDAEPDTPGRPVAPPAGGGTTMREPDDNAEPDLDVSRETRLWNLLNEFCQRDAYDELMTDFSNSRERGKYARRWSDCQIERARASGQQ